MTVTDITTAGLSADEHQRRITYLAAITGYITTFEQLRYYTGDALRSEVVAAIRADHAALEAWYELLMDLRADLADVVGPEEYTPAVGVFVAEEIARYDTTRARYNDLVVHWLISGTRVYYDDEPATP